VGVVGGSVCAWKIVAALGAGSHEPLLMEKKAPVDVRDNAEVVRAIQIKCPYARHCPASALQSTLEESSPASIMVLMTSGVVLGAQAAGASWPMIKSELKMRRHMVLPYPPMSLVIQ